MLIAADREPTTSSNRENRDWSGMTIDPMDYSDPAVPGNSDCALTLSPRPAISDLASRVSAMSSESQRFLSDILRVYDSSYLSEEERNRINDSTGLAGLLGDFIKKNRCPDRYAREKVGSVYG